MTPAGDGDVPSPRRARRAGLVDAALCVLAGLPVLAVLAGSGDLFVFSAFMLPVGVMVACSFDPLEPGDVVRRDA